MAQKPENSFIATIHRRLPTVYCEKMCNPYRSGTPDVYYSGSEGDLWVEYKYVPAVRSRGSYSPDLSARQLAWLSSRHAEGRRVAVIAGCKNGGVLYQDREWELPLDWAEFSKRIIPRDELAAWIKAQVGASACTQLSSS